MVFLVLVASIPFYSFASQAALVPLLCGFDYLASLASDALK